MITHLPAYAARVGQLSISGLDATKANPLGYVTADRERLNQLANRGVFYTTTESPIQIVTPDQLPKQIRKELDKLKLNEIVDF